MSFTHCSALHGMPDKKRQESQGRFVCTGAIGNFRTHPITTSILSKARSIISTQSHMDSEIGFLVSGFHIDSIEGPMAATTNSVFLLLEHNSLVKPSTDAFSSKQYELRQHCALPSISSRGLLYTRRVHFLKPSRRTFAIKAVSSDDGKSSNAAGIFVGGFVLGGILVGALSCVYAQKISSALAGADRKEVLKKLPKFIYDEEKAAENTKQALAKKIEELNSSIDSISLP